MRPRVYLLMSKWLVIIAMQLHIRLIGGELPLLADAHPIVQNVTVEELGTSAEIYCVLEDEDGVLYAGSDRLLVYDGAKWTQAAVENTRFIRSLAKDGKKIWCGGISEVGYFEPGPGGVLVYHSETSRVK